MGKWSDALSRAFGERAPELAKTLLQSLKDHKSGKKKLTASQLRTTRSTLRKLMAPAEIEEALDLVKAPPTTPSKSKKKPDHS
jgi:DNA-binding NtrC family response regulator